MKTRRLWFGSDFNPRVFGPRLPQFPDIDRNWLTASSAEPGTDRTAAQSCVGAKAFALAPETDVDAVRVYFDDDDEEHYELLLPGRIIRHSAQRVALAPHGLYPSTRPATAPDRPRPARVDAWYLDVTYDEFNNPTATLYNQSGAPLTPYQWNGAAYVADVAVADGARILDDVAASMAHNEAGARRMVDFSPDGVWSFVDLWFMGLLDGEPNALVEGDFTRSWFEFDANHNPGDNGAAPGALFYVSGRRIDPVWLARAGLLVYDDCPAPGEVARVLPERRYTFRARKLAQSAAPGTCDQVLAVTPLGNVEQVVFTWKGSGGSIFAALAGVTPHDLIERINAGGVITPDPAVASAAGAQQQIVIPADALPGAFLQLQLGTSAAAGLSLLAGAELVLRRRSCGG